MKHCLPLMLALLLIGCSAGEAEPSKPSTPSEVSFPETEIITTDTLRAEYEAQGFIVREIVPYAGDFLVYYGTEPGNGIFQWVYTATGLRAPLLFSDREILDYTIISPGCVRVLQGSANVYNGALSFPTYQYATTALSVWADGEIPTDFSTSGSVQRETYWAPVSESHTWGWDHGKVALVDARVTARGIEAVFGPTADNIGGFFAAASSIPLTETVCDEANHTLTVTFQNTALTSGILTEFPNQAEQAYYLEYQELYGLPTSFPAGKLEGSNLLISQAKIRQDGENTQIILTLTEAARQYTAESGQLLRDESRPWLSISFREPA